MLHRHRLLFALLACMAALITARASANGRFPTAQHVLVGPGTRSDTIVLRATFGLIISDDGGKTFRYVCEDAMGYGGSSFDPAVGLDGSGRMFVGLFDGAVLVDVDRCGAARTPTLEKQFVSDVDTNVKGDVVAVSTATGFVDDRNYVWRSTDSGGTFTRLGTGVLGVQFDTLELADTNDLRLYATALQLSPRRIIVYRSDDGGATLVDLTSFPQPDAIGAYVAAVDPVRADTVYVRTIVAKVPGPGRQTALFRTDDAGLTWKEVVRTTGLMTGFAISGDGETLWIGGLDKADGLQRSTDRGATWRRLGDTSVQCLRWHADVLYVCASNEIDHYALGRSCDQGVTIHPLLGLTSIAGVFACPASSLETTTCPGRLDAIRPQFPTGDRPREEDCTSTRPDAGPDGTPLVDSGDETDDAASTPDTVGADADASGRPDTSTTDASSEGSTGSGSGCDCSLGSGTTRHEPATAQGMPSLVGLVLGSLALLRRRPSRRRP